MPVFSRFATVLAISVLAFPVLTGCETMNNTEKGVGLGAATGAGLGAIIGHQTGNKGAGALIGAATGGLLGGAIGKAKDNAEETEMYRQHAAYESSQRDFERSAIL